MGFGLLTREAEPRFDERQRLARLPTAQQDVGTQVQEVGYQVVIPGGPRNR